LYHVVNCAQGNICRFGAVRGSFMHPNAIGDMIRVVWAAIPETFPAVSLDDSIVMPNHHHGIVFIEPQPGDRVGPSLGDVMKWFKTITTVRYSHGVRGDGLTRVSFPLHMFRSAFFRVTVVTADGGKAWTNPVWLDDRP